MFKIQWVHPITIIMYDKQNTVSILAFNMHMFNLPL